MNKLPEYEQDKTTQSPVTMDIPLTAMQQDSLYKIAKECGVSAQELISCFVADLTGWGNTGSAKHQADVGHWCVSRFLGWK